MRLCSKYCSFSQYSTPPSFAIEPWLESLCIQLNFPALFAARDIWHCFWPMRPAEGHLLGWGNVSEIAFVSLLKGIRWGWCHLFLFLSCFILLMFWTVAAMLETRGRSQENHLDNLDRTEILNQCLWHRDGLSPIPVISPPHRRPQIA